MSSNLQGSNNYGNSVVKQEPLYSAPAAGQQSGGGSYGAGAYNQGNRGSYGTNQGGVGGGGGAADSYQGAGYQAGGQRAGQQSGRPGDWTCPQCNVNVYASKPACFKCGTPKIAGSNGASYGNHELSREQLSEDVERPTSHGLVLPIQIAVLLRLRCYA